MKQITITITLLMAVFSVTAQTDIHTKGYQVCDFNDVTKSYSNCRYDSTFESRFVFNDSEKSFSHFTTDMKSTYYIDSTINEVGEDVYYATSDVENRYLFVFDYAEEKVIYIYPMDGSYVIATRIKEIFESN